MATSNVLCRVCLRPEDVCRCGSIEVRHLHAVLVQVRAERDALVERNRALEAAQQREAALVQALEKIAHPIAYMQREVEKAGLQLDGERAVRLSNDPGWLKGIAQAALLLQGEQQAQQKEGAQDG